MIKLSKLLPYIRDWVRGTIFTWVIYIIVWLCMMFCNWEYVNPFNWIINIPNKDSTYRGKILLIYGMISLAKCMPLILRFEFNKSKR